MVSITVCHLTRNGIMCESGNANSNVGYSGGLSNWYSECAVSLARIISTVTLIRQTKTTNVHIRCCAASSHCGSLDSLVDVSNQRGQSPLIITLICCQDQWKLIRARVSVLARLNSVDSVFVCFLMVLLVCCYRFLGVASFVWHKCRFRKKGRLDFKSLANLSHYSVSYNHSMLIRLIVNCYKQAKTKAVCM